MEKLSVHDNLNTIEKVNKDLFTNIFKLLKIVTTLSVSSFKPGRSFSIIKRIKTCIRNSIGMLTLNELVSLNIRQQAEVIVEEIIQTLALNQKRLALILFNKLLINHWVLIITGIIHFFFLIKIRFKFITCILHNSYNCHPFTNIFVTLPLVINTKKFKLLFKTLSENKKTVANILPT